MTTQDYLIREFLIYNWYRQIVKQLTGEESLEDLGLLREHEKNSPSDLIISTKSKKVGFEFYGTNNIPEVSNIIHKINQRRKNNPDVNFWVAVLPEKPTEDKKSAHQYGVDLAIPKIYTVGWLNKNNSDRISFVLLLAYYNRNIRNF